MTILVLLFFPISALKSLAVTKAMPTFFALNSKKIAASNFLGLFIVRSLELKKNGFSIAQ